MNGDLNEENFDDIDITKCYRFKENKPLILR